MGLLDEAIEKETATTRNQKLDRILATLGDFEDKDRLLDMLTAPTDQWGHKAMAGIIRHVCDELGVPHEDVNEDNVSRWRETERARGGS